MLQAHRPAAKCFVETTRRFGAAPRLRCPVRGVLVSLLMHKWLLQLLGFCFAATLFGATPPVAPAAKGEDARESAAPGPAVAEPPMKTERTPARRVYVIP